MLGLYEKAMPAALGWREKLEETKTSGFDYLEMSVDETDEKLARLEWPETQRRELVRMMADTGVPVRSLCLSGHRRYPLGARDAAVRERARAIMERAITLAADLGFRVIQLAGYDSYYEPGGEDTQEYFREGLRRAAGMAALAGVQLGFETMETPFMDTVTKAMTYVREIDSPYLGVYPDLGNLTNAAVLYHGSVAADLRSGSGHLLAAHLKETSPGRYREVPYGAGHTDFAAGVRLLKALGVRRFVGELWYTGGDDWRGELMRANAFLRGYLDEAFTEGVV